jgi:large subunit ribosomal protein L21
MYAVIRAGGKQYRVAPGDVIRVEKTPASNGKVEFTDVLAVSGQEGQVGRPQGAAKVVGSVVEEGRADKILVFHFKRKKQYKKLAGHRQPFTAVRITEIAFDGQKFTAPDEPKAEKKAKPAAKAEAHAAEKHEAKHAAPKAAAKKSEAKHKAAPKKGGSKKK